MEPARREMVSGFSLIQISILLTVAALLMVAVLPSPQATVQRNAGSVTKMNAVLTALRQYQAATCTLPCPADPTQPIGANNYGRAAANPGTGSPGNCIGGTPAAAYADTTNHIAIGMVPIYTIGLSYDYALDSWGRNITYAVDTNATAANWSSLTLPGAITVNDYGNIHDSVVALVSHGQDGYGAWLPLQGTSGTAPRFNNGSTDTAQADNAQVAHGGGLTANTTFASFINQSQTATFDDQVVYHSAQWNVNAVPLSVAGNITPPTNGTYSAPQVLTFTITSPQILTVTGTPQLDLSALAGGSIGSSNKAYATYASGSGSNTLTFTYQIQSSDNAPNGLSMTAPVDLNGGTIFPCLPFNAPDLSQVLITACAPGYSYCRSITIDHTKVPNTDQTNFPVLFSGTYSYLATVGNSGNVQNASGYDIIFTGDQAGTTKYNFERESYTASSGAVNFWVQVPTVSHTTDTTFYVQYGNASVVTDQQNASGTWDSNYKGVYHLGGLNDSTSNTKNFTNILSATNTAELFANGYKFASSTNYVYTTTLPMTVTDNFTMSAWVKPSSLPGSGSAYIIVANGPDTTTSGLGSGYAFDIYNNGSTTHWITRYPQGTGNAWATDAFDSGVTPTSGVWTYVVVTRNAGTSQMYINGAAAGATSSKVPVTPATVFSIGESIYQTSPSWGWHLPYAGGLDEVRLSSTPRSADWIATEYNNQNSPSTFYTIGSR